MAMCLARMRENFVKSVYKGGEMKINEIFYSIQGEGINTGVPSVFVRLSGCNLDCDFCDTEHTDFTEMDIDEVCDKITDHCCDTVVFTGGEPMLQTEELLELVSFLNSRSWNVHLETNGTIDIGEFYPYLKHITVSPKEKCVVTRCDEVKVVYYGQNLDYIRHYGIKADFYVLQPKDNDFSCIQMAVNYAKMNPNWRVMLQSHKIMGVE